MELHFCMQINSKSFLQGDAIIVDWDDQAFSK